VYKLICIIITNGENEKRKQVVEKANSKLSGKSKEYEGKPIKQWENMKQKVIENMEDKCE
jgi:hypothetical protein